MFWEKQMEPEEEKPGIDRPLRLHEVLEQEYEHIHGPLPQDHKYWKDKAEQKHKLKERLEEIEDEEKSDQEKREARNCAVKAYNEALVQTLQKLLNQTDQAALCLSGGGIRSATFCLGIVQGLSRHGWLKNFDYLSTVSGGGYIGAWLSAWINRRGTDQVTNGLQWPPLRPNTLDPEPQEIKHLRAYSNYWTPKLGWLSADTWAVISAYLRNLLLNWAILIPFFLVILALPRFWIKALQAILNGSPKLSLTTVEYSALGAGTLLAFWGMMYIALNLPTMKRYQEQAVGRRLDWFLQGKDDERGFLIHCLLPLGAAAILLATYWAAARKGNLSVDACKFMAYGALLHLSSWIPAFYREWKYGRPSWHIGLISIVILAVGLLGGELAWLVATFLGKTFLNDPAAPEWYAVLAAPLLLTAFMGAGVALVGLLSWITTDEDREWWGRSSGWILIALAVWMGGFLLVVSGPTWLAESFHFLAKKLGAGGESNTWVAIVTGILSLLAGGGTAYGGYSTASPGTAAQQGPEFSWRLKVGAALFTMLFVIALSILTTWALAKLAGIESIPRLPGDHFHHIAILRKVPLDDLVLFVAPLAVLFNIAAWAININKFSLHALYRNRLMLAYLAASRKPNERTPVQFTGFDEHDNLEMHTLRKEQGEGKNQRPFHIINMALNLVNSRNLAWQERKAAAFSASPLHIGNKDLGYRPADHYGRDPNTRRAISLATAMAISGAAISPNMGYNSSPTITFIMALFNLRLGWWVGNPGESGQNTWARSSPKWALGPMLNEALGRTDDQKGYVFLSDGGHFENLALYEMVLRRCRFILIVDAGEDNDCTFEDLGNAIRKIRVDFGVHIELDRVRIVPRKGRKAGDVPKYCAIGTIKYTELGEPADGRLIYIKPTLCPEENLEPMDIYSYSQFNERFPHEPTKTDQWFSESQFESYRMLGSHVIEQLWRETDLGETLVQLENNVRAYLGD